MIFRKYSPVALLSVHCESIYVSIVQLCHESVLSFSLESSGATGTKSDIMWLWSFL